MVAQSVSKGQREILHLGPRQGGASIRIDERVHGPRKVANIARYGRSEHPSEDGCVNDRDIGAGRSVDFGSHEGRKIQRTGLRVLYI